MWSTVSELTGCNGMPGTERGCRKYLDNLAAKNPSVRRKKAGTKAFEYQIDFLPLATQEDIKNRFYRSILENRSQEVAAREIAARKAAAQEKGSKLELMRQCPALLEREVQQLTARQKQIADARAALAMEVEKLRDSGLSRTAAVAYVANNSRNGTLPAHLQEAARHANARPGSTRTGVGTRSLQEWLTIFETTKPGAERMAMLAPGHLKAKKPEQIAWVPMFMAHYRNTNGHSVAEAYKDFHAEWEHRYADQPAMLNAVPSIYAVHRALNKMPKIVRQRGRVTGSAMTALKTYVKRDWSQMPVNGVWIGDGHSMKMKVQHPDHGRPFTPEITLVIDGRTRYVVGWSLGLAENVIAVADAIRHGIERHGVPLLYYSDNGAGETAKLLDADLTGILPRLGIEHPTGIPGNPQARGIIERLNREIPARIARKFATYNGKSADKETVRITSRAIDSAANAINQNKDLNPVQKAAIAKLPTWNQLIDAIEDEINAYNTKHRHSELPRREDGQHYTAAEYRAELLADADIDRLSEAELREMFRPQVKRVAQRGWLSVFNNQYFSEDLIQVDGEEVLVAFDIHDAGSVTVRRLDGSFVCTAIVNGNTRAAFPVDYIEKVKKDRHARRMALVNKKAEEIDAELNPVRTIEHTPDFGALLGDEINQINDEREPMFLFESEREEYLRRKNKAV